ncbi:MAG: hypothetical protein KUG72_11295 [Pseudomonadales bacterium]|nr:hypothetical protein [Pseudomonadales bacterium]
MLKNLKKPLFALILASLSSVIVGSFFGWSTNPDRSAAFLSSSKEMAESGYYGTLEEVERKHAELAKRDSRYYAQEPPTYIAILKSNTPLLGVFSLLWMILLRPNPSSVIPVFLLGCVVVTLLVNSMTAFFMVVAIILYVAACTLFERKKPTNTT